MVDSRNLISRFIEKVEYQEEKYKNKLINTFEDTKEVDYLSLMIDKKIESVNKLIDYYNDIKTSVEKINFQNFAKFVIKDEEETKIFLQELKNISLLKGTGLLKYAKEQETYSKRIISNFILKLNNIKENKLPSTFNQEEMEQKLERIKKYKSYFAPIGIVKEVEDIDEFNEFLNDIDISKKDQISLLFMTLSFNNSYHDNILSNYTLDLQLQTPLIKNKKYLNKEDLEKIKRLIKEKDINSFFKEETKEKVEKEVELENNVEEILEDTPIIIENTEINTEDIKTDSFKIIEEKEEKPKKEEKANPYNLFEKYNELLQNNKPRTEEDKKILKTASDFYKANQKLIKNLNEITLEDIEDTMNVYKINEELRDIVYHTTENIERLLTFEINDILINLDYKDPEYTNKLVDDLKPVVEYINIIKKPVSKKKK